MSFKNLKIAINDQQPLDEVVMELERLGYKPAYETQLDYRSVIADVGGYFSILNIKFKEFNTTLSELKEI